MNGFKKVNIHKVRNGKAQRKELTEELKKGGEERKKETG